ncbi:MAG: alpha/beta fold hydrolase, partial [Bacteroidia bacterium]|nr:alpha/beta fold hydrolase [Bacteroidia bacterium]
MIKALIILLVVIVVLFIIGNLWTYPFQQYFIFRPEKLNAEYKFKFEYPFEEINLKTKGGGLINALLFRTQEQERKGVVLYFHGNADNNQRWGTLYPQYVYAGYDLFIMDYRGFGKSRGKVSQRLMYRDALSCYDYVSKLYKAEDIIIYGRSLGTTMACYVASKENARVLILETPFYSMKDLFYCYYPLLPRLFVFKFPFPS